MNAENAVLFTHSDSRRLLQACHGTSLTVLLNNLTRLGTDPGQRARNRIEGSPVFVAAGHALRVHVRELLALGLESGHESIHLISKSRMISQSANMCRVPKSLYWKHTEGERMVLCDEEMYSRGHIQSFFPHHVSYLGGEESELGEALLDLLGHRRACCGSSRLLLLLVVVALIELRRGTCSSLGH